MHSKCCALLKKFVQLKFRNSLQTKTNCNQFEMANNTRMPRIYRTFAKQISNICTNKTTKSGTKKNANANDIEFREILKLPHHGHQSKTLITIF